MIQTILNIGMKMLQHACLLTDNACFVTFISNIHVCRTLLSVLRSALAVLPIIRALLRSSQWYFKNFFFFNMCSQ